MTANPGSWYSSAPEAQQAPARFCLFSSDCTTTPDPRGSIAIGPDGRVYPAVRVDNRIGFGGGYLHHLARYDPAAGRTEDQVAVSASCLARECSGDARMT